MDVCEFRERTYGKYKTQLFVLEPTWDSFRPISFVGWNGTDLVIVDNVYKQDLLSPVYGYGSEVMKRICQHLLEVTELGNKKEFKDPAVFWKWCEQADVVWWRDRPCVFASSCVSQDVTSWKKYVSCIQSRPKTLRNSIMRRVTKRLRRKE
jgi:hypothetical protein